jgi:hypothetical protein
MMRIVLSIHDAHCAEHCGTHQHAAFCRDGLDVDFKSEQLVQLPRAQAAACRTSARPCQHWVATDVISAALTPLTLD